MPIIILILGLSLFFPSFTHPFVWDDEEQILNNTAITSLSNLPQFFLGSTFNAGGAAGLTGLYYKPLLTTSYALLYSLFGRDATGYHVAQVLLHSVNSILLYLLLRRHASRKLYPSVAALIFLLHPVQIESVVYVAGLQEPLFFFFGISALLLTRIPLLSGMLVLLSLLSKETGGVFALAVPIYASLVLKQKKLPMFVASFGATAIYLIMRLGIARLPILEHNLTPINRLSLVARLPTVPAIITHYLTDLSLPFNLSISEHWIVTELTWTSFYLPLLVSVAVLVVLIKLARKKALSIFWLICLVLSLGLHLHLVPLDFTTSDRWLYLPLASVLGLVVSLLPPPPRLSTLLIDARFILFAVYGVVVIIASSLRISIWRSGLSLYSSDIMKVPQSFDLNNNLGVELYRNNQVSAAKKYFLRSTELAPYWWTNWNNYGVVLEAEGEYEAALAAYKLAIQNGEYYLAYENYARLLYSLKRNEEAKSFVNEALQKLPGNPLLLELATIL